MLFAAIVTILLPCARGWQAAPPTTPLTGTTGEATLLDPAGRLRVLANSSRCISRGNGVHRRFFASVDSLQDALLFKQIGVIDVVAALSVAPRRTIYDDVYD